MVIRTQPLTAQAFAPYGDVIESRGDPDMLINEGLCGRFHDRAQLDFGDGRAGLSLFHATPRSLPYMLTLLERHPLGAQAFIPMSFDPFLVIVAQDLGSKPGKITAFLSAAGQAINFHKGTWHGVLTPLSAPGLFTVIDRIGDGNNLEEFRLEHPVMIERG
ncbi:ureidoglycolate lyase [uncultured Litoreibacter sp.]|uniref:ureidoglycolate lyase n=1 Tax=uncultured Litoreibacter sp. TaxID=1392394 RepID=UPI002614AFF4|nr:ureidoglycolate lyase [uncultured Litoreibacter sp.]